MSWGSQYDAMLNWMQKNGVDVSVVADDTNTIGNSSTTTGSQEKDFMKNIYDLYGCHTEWTLEAESPFYRIHRGGPSSRSPAPSDRDNNAPNSTLGYLSARLTLYIK